jgi:hypothetical protein
VVFVLLWYLVFHVRLSRKSYIHPERQQFQLNFQTHEKLLYTLKKKTAKQSKEKKTKQHLQKQKKTFPKKGKSWQNQVRLIVPRDCPSMYKTTAMVICQHQKTCCPHEGITVEEEEVRSNIFF